MAQADPSDVAPGTASRLPWWARIVVAFAFLELLSVDPLNVNSASAQRSEEAVMRLAAPFYRASREVTVVLVDDEFLSRTGSGWPLSYREQGLLLRRLLSYEPSAVFVDLLYRHRHGSAAGEAPADLLRALPEPAGPTPPALLFAVQSRAPASADRTERGPGIDGEAHAADDADGPAFCVDAAPPGALPSRGLADPASVDVSLRGLLGLPAVEGAAPVAGATPDEPLPAAVRARVAPGIGLVGWSGCGTRYPLLLAADRASPTPAMAAFRAHCARRSQARGCADVGDDAAFAAPMILRWGAFPSDLQVPFYARGVCQSATGPDGAVSAWQRFSRWVQQLALGAITDLRRSRDVERSLPCPAVPVLRADQLLDGDEAALRALLRDKAVLLGASVSGVPDWQGSPVHGRIPGVVLHAMALDNLLAFGAGYTRPMPSQVAYAIKVALAIAVALLAPWLLRLRPSRPTARTRAALGLALWVGFAIYLFVNGFDAQGLAALLAGVAFDLFKPTDTLRYALLLAAMATLALLALAAGWSPWNWIGLLLVIVATVEAIKPFLKSTTPKPFPHPASLFGPLAARAARSYLWIVARYTT